MAVSQLSVGREDLTLRKEAEGLLGSGKGAPEDHGGGSRAISGGALLPPSSALVPSLGG